MYKRRMRLGEMVKRLFFVLILGSAVLVVGSKFYIEYRIKTFLDQIALDVAGAGQFKYLEVYSKYDGRVGVKNLGFYPSDNVDIVPILIDEIELSTPSYLYLLGLEGDGLPRSMSLELKGLRVDSGSFLDLGRGTDGASISGNPFESLACGNVDSFRAPDLSSMGFQEADRVDLAISYNLLSSSSFTISLTQSTANISIIRLLLNFNAEGLHLLRVGQQPTGVELKSGNLTLSASGFSNSRNRFCAELTELTVEQFVEANIQATLAALRNKGWRPEAELVEQYRAFMLGSGWTLEAKPVSPLAMTEALSLDSDLLLDRLKLNSKLTGQQTIPFRFAKAAPTPIPEDAPSETATPVMDPLTGLSRSMVVINKKPDPLVEVPRAKLELFIDSYVKIRTVRRKEYIGLLIEVVSNGLRIRTRLPSGSADIEIPFEQTTSITVRESVFKSIVGSQPECTGVCED